MLMKRFMGNRYSKLPFRALVRDYGVDLCYTPMVSIGAVLSYLHMRSAERVLEDYIKLTDVYPGSCRSSRKNSSALRKLVSAVSSTVFVFCCFWAPSC